MLDALGPGTILGYCANVHAGNDLATLLGALDRHAVAVRAEVCPGAPLAVGLWLPARAAAQALRGDGPARIADWLAERGLLAYTVNAFPFGDFHGEVVKRRVYRPDWRSEERLAYTIDMARLLATLLPPGAEGSLSTLPVGWGPALAGDDHGIAVAAGNLRRAAGELARLEEETGRLLHLDLEPEPGCVLATAAETVAFFDRHLTDGRDATRLRRHLRVCHDVCHAAVMFEEQAAVLDTYRRAGVKVGKVQISAAPRARVQAGEAGAAARGALARYVEPRYLHQTTVRGADGRIAFHEDLPAALDAAGAGEWRVHFHVPVFLSRLGALETTADEIVRCLAALTPADGVRHFEVETYAWSVLPPEVFAGGLADGLARELAWARAQATERSAA